MDNFIVSFVHRKMRKCCVMGIVYPYLESKKMPKCPTCTKGNKNKQKQKQYNTRNFHDHLLLLS